MMNKCPQCGFIMNLNISTQILSCKNCGYKISQKLWNKAWNDYEKILKEKGKPTIAMTRQLLKDLGVDKKKFWEKVSTL